MKNIYLNDNIDIDEYCKKNGYEDKICYYNKDNGNANWISINKNNRHVEEFGYSMTIINNLRSGIFVLK